MGNRGPIPRTIDDQDVIIVMLTPVMKSPATGQKNMAAGLLISRSSRSRCWPM
jgi:hypothetical protein